MLFGHLALLRSVFSFFKWRNKVHIGCLSYCACFCSRVRNIKLKPWLTIESCFNENPVQRCFFFQIKSENEIKEHRKVFCFICFHVFYVYLFIKTRPFSLFACSFRINSVYFLILIKEITKRRTSLSTVGL